MTTTDDSMIAEFLPDATEMLAQAETDLLSLDQGGDFKNHFDSIFRMFHSLKGCAGMLGMEPLQKHMHLLESLLSNLKEKVSLQEDEVGFFLHGIDAARQFLAGQPLHFTVAFPDGTPAKKTATLSATPPKVDNKTKEAPPKSPIKTLAFLVDDEPDILEILSDILRDADIETRTFTNPLEALKACTIGLPDLILTDLKMPEMSGTDLLRQVRELNSDIPVIIVSGFLGTANLLDAIRSGIFAVIEKPFNRGVVTTYVLAAARQTRLTKMFRRGLNLLLYQFSDLEEFLNSHGKVDIAKAARTELTTLLTQWKELNSVKIPAKPSKI